MILLAILFACMEFSATFAVLGLEFVNVLEDGELDSVLSLESEVSLL